jgi:hypothetical protein
MTLLDDTTTTDDKPFTAADFLAGGTPPRDDAPANDAPPRKRRGRPPGSTNAKARKAPLENRLEEFFTGIAMLVSFANETDGMIVAANAKTLATAWGNLARENANVNNALETLLAGNAWSGAVVATAMVAIPILDNHKLLPGSLPFFNRKPVPVADDND